MTQSSDKDEVVQRRWQPAEVRFEVFKARTASVGERVDCGSISASRRDGRLGCKLG